MSDKTVALYNAGIIISVYSEHTTPYFVTSVIGL
jgi:hypothetical protein